MGNALNLHRIVLPTALVALAMGVFLTATQAHADYAGYYGHSYSGDNYRGHYPFGAGSRHDPRRFGAGSRHDRRRFGAGSRFLRRFGAGR